MFFSLCRAVRTTAKKKKKKKKTTILQWQELEDFFLSQLAAILKSDWPVPFSIGTSFMRSL